MVLMGHEVMMGPIDFQRAQPLAHHPEMDNSPSRQTNRSLS